MARLTSGMRTAIEFIMGRYDMSRMTSTERQLLYAARGGNKDSLMELISTMYLWDYPEVQEFGAEIEDDARRNGDW